MLRTIVSAAIRSTVVGVQTSVLKCHVVQPSLMPSSMLSNKFSTLLPKNGLPALVGQQFLNPVQNQINQERTLTKFSLNKGKRKTVRAVLKRFKRLDWGVWIRTHSGRHKKLWKKSPALRRRLKQHVFVNATQSWLLDKMVTSYWKKPKHYIDDPYAPYHKREDYWSTRKRPVEYVKKSAFD